MPLNKVFLLGNLTRDPELRYTPGGAAVCEFGLAVNRTYVSNNQTKEEACFVDITAWGKTAELCQRYLGKGSQALIEGRLQLDTWEDKNTGRRASKLRVIAENVQFVGAPRRNGEDGAPAAPRSDRYESRGGYDNAPRNSDGPGGYRAQGAPAPRQMGAPVQNDPNPPMPAEAFNPDGGDDDIPF